MAKSSKPASKSSTKRSSSVSSSMGALAVSKQIESSVRQIENGFIVRESGYVGKGKSKDWVSKEYFSAKNPLAGVKSGMKFGGRK